MGTLPDNEIKDLARHLNDFDRGFLAGWDACKKEYDAEQKEIKKCKASPYYFYTKYVTVNGKPVVPFLTEEQFNKRFKFFKNET